MSRRPSRPLRLLIFSMVALTVSILFASSAHALPFLGRHRSEGPRVSEERGRGFFSLLVSLFGKSGGAMDPNGGGVTTTGPVAE